METPLLPLTSFSLKAPLKRTECLELMQTITLTQQLLHTAATSFSGWNRYQMQLLGVWPPQKGWLRGLIGKRVSVEVWEQVMKLAGTKSKERKEIHQRKSQPELAIAGAQAQKIFLQFDGGCGPTNPGNMYGSFLVRYPQTGRILKAKRIELGYGTNNEAEFLTLQRALEALVDDMAKQEHSTSEFAVEIQTDSLIVQHRIAHKQKNRTFDLKVSPFEDQHRHSRSNRMTELALDCHALLAKFNNHKIRWQPRQKNVEVFGH